MERTESVAWQIVGGAVVVLILSAITIHSTVGWSPVGAAWVQAVGSVMALFVTGGIVIWEVRQRRLEMARLVAERLLARVEVFSFVAERIAAYADFLDPASPKPSRINGFSRLARLRYALKHAKLIEMAEMPTSGCVQALANCRLVIDLIEENDLLTNSLERARDGRDQAEQERTLSILRDSAVQLEKWILKLKGEADRLVT